MAFIIGIAQAADLNLVSSGMDKLIVSNVDPHMRDALFVCIIEKDKITRLWVGDIVGTAVVSFRTGSWDAFSDFVKYIVDKPAAIKSYRWRRASENIRDANVFFCFRNHCGIDVASGLLYGTAISAPLGMISFWPT